MAIWGDNYYEEFYPNIRYVPNRYIPNKHLSVEERQLFHNVDNNRTIETIRYLDDGINPNIKNDRGYPLLLVSMERRRDDMTNLLINHPQIDLFACNEYGDNALHYAVDNNRIDLVKLLLNKGLDVNKKGQGGDTPLHNAVVYNRLSMVKLLLDHGADLSITNDHNQTPLDIAVEEEYSKIVDYITSYERIDIKEPEFD